MMEAAGVTEELKAGDPMRWVGLMNELKAQVDEIILHELMGPLTLEEIMLRTERSEWDDDAAV